MKLSRRDIAEAFGMYYHGEFYDDNDVKVHRFHLKGKVFDVDCWHDIDSAWDIAAKEFLQPLEKLLF